MIGCDAGGKAKPRHQHGSKCIQHMLGCNVLQQHHLKSSSVVVYDSEEVVVATGVGGSGPTKSTWMWEKLRSSIGIFSMSAWACWNTFALLHFLHCLHHVLVSVARSGHTYCWDSMRVVAHLPVCARLCTY